MIDHALGRPDARWRKYQIFAVVIFWSLFLYKTNRQGPRFLRPLFRFFDGKLSVWHAVVITCLNYYVLQNLSTVLGVQSPDPLADMYSKEYFRATWVTTALDAGFWSAMYLRPKWLKDIASMAFSVYFLIAAEHADEKVRRVRGKITKEHMRVSWEKPKTPYLAFITNIMRPRRLRMDYPPRRRWIMRPRESDYKLPIDAWLYFDGPTKDLKNQDKIILDIPGGGFVAMDPRCHDDRLMAWAKKTGLPVLSLEYKKAPEFPYPYALNECYDAYHTIITSQGRAIGLPGLTIPKIVVSGDSAGGNLAVGLTLKIIEGSPHSSWFPGNNARKLPLPEALVLVYPTLDMNITSWMTDEQIALMDHPSRRVINQGVIKNKRDTYRSLTNTPYTSDDEDEDGNESLRPTTSVDPKNRTLVLPTSSGQFATSRLHMRSMIAFFNDRILSPEMLRAMIIMYVGLYNIPEFTTDKYLSPLLAPEAFLAEFPKVYMMTGERDPMSDDTVLFAGRLEEAHLHRFAERQEQGLIPDSEEFDSRNYVEYELIQRISHGFMQFASVFPEAYGYMEQCSRWMKEAFAAADARDALGPQSVPQSVVSDYGDDYFGNVSERRGSISNAQQQSDGGDRPLMMRQRRALKMTPLQTSGTDAPNGGAHRRDRSGRGKIKKHAFSGRKSPVATRSELSHTRLPSNEDLMLRRMNEVAAGLISPQISRGSR